MAVRTRSFKRLCRLLPLLKGPAALVCRKEILSSGHGMLGKMHGGVIERGYLVRWCSTMADHLEHHMEKETSGKLDFQQFFRSALNEPDGPHYYWLNHVGKTQPDVNGIILVVVDVFLGEINTHVSGNITVLERAKLLQHRFPNLNIFGLQSVVPALRGTSEVQIIQTIMKEFITFPVLLSYKDLTEITKESSYLMFSDGESPAFSYDKHAEMHVIIKDIEDCLQAENKSVSQVLDSNSSWIRQSEVIMEPHACSSFRNLLLYYPSGIASDKEKRLFISDSNHHRIIITDSDGKLLDCIGSSPGFEDGDYDSAKLLRPAASIYDHEENCLFFVDAENHAIRKANIESRLVETVYPIPHNYKKLTSIWSWVLNKLGMLKTSSDNEVSAKPTMTPWHLLKSKEDDLLVINRSFDQMWTISRTGKIKEIVEGTSHIVKMCEEAMHEKLSLLNKFPGSWVQGNMEPKTSKSELPNLDLMSSVVNIENCILLCDRVGHSIMKSAKSTGEVSCLQLSSFEILGVPYWLHFPLERILSKNTCRSPTNTYCHHFNVLPGRCDVRVKVKIPDGTLLASKLEEGSIWRQTRGSAVEILGSKAVAISSEKVEIAQQWFDELDNLAFSNAEETTTEDEKAEAHVDNFVASEGMDIDCAVNVSPGTSEVLVCAVFYLKLDDSICEQRSTGHAKMVLDMTEGDETGKEEDACAHLLLEACRDLREIIFMKPLQLKISLDCGDYPSTANPSKEVILSNTTLHINASLV